MFFSKTRKVNSPLRAHEIDAGIDFFCPTLSMADLIKASALNEYNCEITKNEDGIIVSGHKDVLIPSGIYVNVNPGMALIAFNKSGIATKKKLIVGACVIDSGYQGEVHIHLINTKSDDVVIDFGQKIAQFIYMPISMEFPVELPREDLYKDASARGSGGFGSTDKR
jgi:dUTP pyrophosphatase